MAPQGIQPFLLRRGKERRIKTMKKILSLSALALILTVLLAGGSTHSWFIDSVALTDNIFTAEIPIQTKRLYDLNIGDRVADITWNWEFKTGDGYTGSGEEKPVVWIVVAKDHYAADTRVLLLSEDVICKRQYDPGVNNYWVDSNARAWLNGDFFNSLPEKFRGAVLSTNLPNVNHLGGPYGTVDKVFFLTIQEMGGNPGYNPCGTVTAYFNATEAVKRVRRKALLGGGNISCWLRTPKGTVPLANVWYVRDDGVIIKDKDDVGTHTRCNSAGYGYRPALNMDGNTLVNSEPENGVHVIHWP